MKQLVPNSQNSRVFAACILVVIGQILLQWVFPANSSLPAGAARGDILLPEDCLPKTITQWTQSGFNRPDKTETDRVWATSWQFRSQHGIALASFDQAAYTGWHELSDCYVATGWEHKTRDSFLLGDDDWPYVVSTFTNRTGQTALVVFSLFYDDGDFASPPAYSLSQPETQQPDLLDRFGGRFSDLHPTKLRQDPTRQCQVFLVGNQITYEIRNAAIQLHLESRQKFRQHWLSIQANQNTVSGGNSES